VAARRAARGAAVELGGSIPSGRLRDVGPGLGPGSIPPGARATGARALGLRAPSLRAPGARASGPRLARPVAARQAHAQADVEFGLPPQRRAARPGRSAAAPRRPPAGAQFGERDEGAGRGEQDGDQFERSHRAPLPLPGSVMLQTIVSTAWEAYAVGECTAS